MDLHNIRRVFHVLVGKLAYMDKTILVNTDIHKHAESRDIGDDARKPHSASDVFDLFNSLCKSERFESLPGVPARPGEFDHDVA